MWDCNISDKMSCFHPLTWTVNHLMQTKVHFTWLSLNHSQDWIQVFHFGRMYTIIFPEYQSSSAFYFVCVRNHQFRSHTHPDLHTQNSKINKMRDLVAFRELKCLFLKRCIWTLTVEQWIIVSVFVKWLLCSKNLIRCLYFINSLFRIYL